MDTNSAEFKAALRDHAKSLGVDPDAEPHLMALVEEALLVEIPEGWEQGETEDGTLYYFNTNTEESIWEHPLDAHYRELIQTKKSEHEAVSRTSNKPWNEPVKPTPATDEPAKPSTAAISSVEVYSFDEDSDEDATAKATTSSSKAGDTPSSSSRILSLFPLQPVPSFSATSAAMTAKKDLSVDSPASSSLSSTTTTATAATKGASSGGGGGFGRDRSWLLDGDDDDDFDIPTLGKPAASTTTTTPAAVPVLSAQSSATGRVESFGGRDDESAFGSAAKPSATSFAAGIASRGSVTAAAASTASNLSYSSRMYGVSASANSASSSLASGSVMSLDTTSLMNLSGSSTSPTQSRTGSGSPRRGGIGSSIKSQFFQEMSSTSSSTSLPVASLTGRDAPSTSLPTDVAKIQQLEKRMSELVKQNEQLTSEFDKTKQQLEQALLDAKESNYLKMKASETKAKLADKDSELRKVAQEHAANTTKLQQEIQQLKAENERLAKNQQQQATSSTQEVVEMRQSAAAAQAEKAALEKELSHLEQKLRTAIQDAAKAKQEVQEHVAKLSKLETTLERERHEHSSEVGALRDSLDLKRKDHDAELQQRRKDHDTELQQLRDQLDALEREMTDKERRTESVGVLQDTLDRQTKFLKEVEEKNKELQSKLTLVDEKEVAARREADEKEATARREVSQREQYCLDISKKLSAAQTELEATKKQIVALNDKASLQSEQVASLEARSSGWLRQEDELKREKASAERERRDLSNELKDKSEELQRVQTQTRKLQDEHLSAVSKLQAETQELQNQLKAIRIQELQPLETQSEQLKRDNERLSERLVAQDKEYRQAKHELSTANNQIHQLQVEIEAWKRKEQQQKAQKDMYASEKASLEKHAASFEAEHSSYKNQKRLETEKLAFRMRELESQLAQKDYEILRVEERFTKAEAWRLKEARRVEERDNQLLDVKEELAQLKNRNVEAENNIVIQELRRDREQLQHRITQLTHELEDERTARQVSGQKFHDELQMMQKGLEWQLPQLAAACVNRSSEEWVRKCHQVVKALRDDFNMKALTERNELLGRIKAGEDARDHVEQKYKNTVAECDFLRKEVHRVEDNNKVLLDQLHTIRVYMTQRPMPGAQAFPPSQTWGPPSRPQHHTSPSAQSQQPPPASQPSSFGAPFTDFSTVNHLNTQLGILHAQFQQLFDATERRPSGISTPKSFHQHQSSQQFSHSDRFEIPVSPPSAAAKQHHFRSASPTTARLGEHRGASDLDETMDVLLDQALEAANGVVIGRSKDLEHEKEQLISTLEAIGLSGSQAKAQLLPAPAATTTTGNGEGSGWYQKDYWRSKYQ